MVNFQKENQKEIHQRDSWRLSQSNVQKIRANDPVNKQKFATFSKEYQNRPDIKEEISSRMRNLWKDPKYADAQLNACFGYKEYIMPSGRIVKIQGNEPIFLTELLKVHNEDDIIIGIVEMNKTIGRIKYMYNNKERTYYPDFYVKSTNTIYEVKSLYTYNIHKEQNIAKKDACVKQGFNYQFKII
jgi:hypothetical protein